MLARALPKWKISRALKMVEVRKHPRGRMNLNAVWAGRDSSDQRTLRHVSGKKGAWKGGISLQ
jgi:hypothetical protein